MSELQQSNRAADAKSDKHAGGSTAAETGGAAASDSDAGGRPADNFREASFGGESRDAMQSTAEYRDALKAERDDAAAIRKLDGDATDASKKN